jgi:hypothetical protein
MSERYQQASHDSKYLTIYGYDNPLETFYLQVYETAAERVTESEGRLIAWLGTLTGELPTIETLIQAAAHYVVIPQPIIKKLETDQQTASGPTPLQRWLRS